MADETLKRLLDAERKGQRQVDEAVQERDRIVAQARAEARQAEQRFDKRVPEIHAAFRDKAEERAQQAVAELQRRYEQYGTDAEGVAAAAEDEAVAAALERLLGRGPGE